MSKKKHPKPKAPAKPAPEDAELPQDDAAEHDAFPDAMPETASKDAPAEEPDYADFMDRLFAAVVDNTLLLLVIWPLFSLLHSVFPGYEEAQQRQAEILVQTGDIMLAFRQSGFLMHWLTDMVLQVALVALVITSFWRKKNGATPGKMLLKMHIVDAKTFQPVTRWQSHRRFIGYFLPLIPPFLAVLLFQFPPMLALLSSVLLLLLSVLWIPLNRRRRAWHDYLAGTVVVYTVKKKRRPSFRERWSLANLRKLVQLPEDGKKP